MCLRQQIAEAEKVNRREREKERHERARERETERGPKGMSPHITLECEGSDGSATNAWRTAIAL
eukprot:14844876-Alexandrium_andersonii.AAC.1